MDASGLGIPGAEVTVSRHLLAPQLASRPLSVGGEKALLASQCRVEAAAAMVETQSTGGGQVVNSQDVVELFLNGRGNTQVITLAASNTVQAGFGQAPSSGNLISSKNYPNEALVSVEVGMLNGTTYLLDGGTHNDPLNNLNLPLPFPDAVQ